MIKILMDNTLVFFINLIYLKYMFYYSILFNLSVSLLLWGKNFGTLRADHLTQIDRLLWCLTLCGNSCEKSRPVEGSIDVNN